MPLGSSSVRTLYPASPMTTSWSSSGHTVRRSRSLHPTGLRSCMVRPCDTQCCSLRPLAIYGIVAWATDERALQDLAQGVFASSLDLPTIERIRQTVPQDTTREFLYRLKLIRWPFGIEQVRQVAAVPPPISFPLDHLATVAGLWVQQDGDREYIVSPLLTRLQDENLPKELQQAIHLALARGILEKRQLGPSQVSYAVLHFLEGGDPEAAASVLLVALHGMLRLSEFDDPFGLTAIWAGMPLPAHMTLKKRIYLRAFQLIVRSRVGKDTQYERADLERLTAEGESDGSCQLIIATVGAMLATYIGDKDPELVIRSTRRSLKAYHRVEIAAAQGPEIGLHTGLLTLLWMAAAWIRTSEQYEEWFAAVRDLTPAEAREWDNSPFAGQASQAICGGIWTRAADLPPGGRDWFSVRDQLDQLKSWAQAANVRSLACSAICNQIIVVAEYQQDLRGAESLAQAGIKEFNDLPQLKFSIADTIARQHHYFGSSADAIRWFDIALTVQDAAGPVARVNCLTIAGIAAHNLSVELARGYLEKGVEVAASATIASRSRVIIRGELGILLWNAGQHREGYAAWSGAAQELLNARENTNEWQTLFMLFGNCTGYFLAGKRSLQSENAAVTVPFSGILLREVKNIQELHKPELDWLLPVQMALLAESVGAYKEAMDWAGRTQVGDGGFRVAAQALIAGALASRALGEQRYAEIIEAVADEGDLDESFENFRQLDEDVRARRTAHISARLNSVALIIEVCRIGLHDRSRAAAIARSAEERARDTQPAVPARCCGLAWPKYSAHFRTEGPHAMNG